MAKVIAVLPQTSYFFEMIVYIALQEKKARLKNLLQFVCGPIQSISGLSLVLYMFWKNAINRRPPQPLNQTEFGFVLPYPLIHVLYSVFQSTLQSLLVLIFGLI